MTKMWSFDALCLIWVACLNKKVGLMSILGHDDVVIVFYQLTQIKQ